jgi:hypothetical protein
LPSVTETVRVVSTGQVYGGYKAKEASAWNWSDLRDYIVEQIEQRHGPQVRDALKESGICKAFIARWGIEDAVAIARAAFEVHDGMWRNAPISISRFAKGSDPYFASVIATTVR